MMESKTKKRKRNQDVGDDGAENTFETDLLQIKDDTTTLKKSKIEISEIKSDSKKRKERDEDDSNKENELENIHHVEKKIKLNIPKVVQANPTKSDRVRNDILSILNNKPVGSKTLEYKLPDKLPRYFDSDYKAQWIKVKSVLYKKGLKIINAVDKNMTLFEPVYVGKMDNETYSIEKDNPCVTISIQKKMSHIFAFISEISKSEYTKYKCQEPNCDFASKRKDHLDSHEITHSIYKPFRCESTGCNFSCKRKNELDSHAITHSTHKKFKCEWTGCDFICKRKSNLNSHMIAHSIDKPFECDWPGCDFTFKRKTNLDLHMKTHSTDMPFTCKSVGCNYKCKLQKYMESHETIHLTDKPFKCKWDGCDFSCKRKSEIKIHAITHSTNRTFKCKLTNCDFISKRKGNLDQHMKVHSNERPFKCEAPNCNHTSKTKSDLDRHRIHKHTSETAFKCKELNCGYACKREDTLKQHIKTIHTEEGQKKQRRKENRFALDLVKNKIVYDPPGFRLSLGCIGGTNIQPDFVIYKEKWIIWLEYNENQHKAYPAGCDAVRMQKIDQMYFVTNQVLPIFFLCVSTDWYSVNGESGKLKRKSIVKLTINTINNYVPIFKPHQRFIIGYIGYDMEYSDDDCDKTIPIICYDKEYPQELVSSVICLHTE